MLVDQVIPDGVLDKWLHYDIGMIQTSKTCGGCSPHLLGTRGGSFWNHPFFIHASSDDSTIMEIIEIQAFEKVVAGTQMIRFV
jgi:hypothetical protein